MLRRRPIPEGGTLWGTTETDAAHALRPRMLDEAGGIFESWDAAVYGGRAVLLVSAGVCRSSVSGAELSFLRAEVVGSSGEHLGAQIGRPGIAAARGRPDLTIVADGSKGRGGIAYAAGTRRFDLTSYLGGEGRASVGQCLTEGRMTAGVSEVSWSGRFDHGRDATHWDLVVPQLPVAPRRWMCFASPRAGARFEGWFSSPSGPGETTTCAGSPAILMRRWGTAHPVSWARVIGAFGPDNPDGRDDSSSELFVSGTWVKMGRLGVLGPPAPKTFFVIHLSGDVASRLGVASGRISFNSPLRALLSSSHVVFPKWEARMQRADVVATVRIDASAGEPFQYELPDPEGAGTFAAQFPFASAEIILETKVGGSWRHAATLRSDRMLVEFGGREALPYLPLMPKEYALGLQR